MLLYNWICCVIVGLIVEIPVRCFFLCMCLYPLLPLNWLKLFVQFLMDPMVLSVLYVWCQLNRNVIVNFWFGTQFKAMYLPWVLFAFNLIISGGYVLNNMYLFKCYNPTFRFNSNLSCLLQWHPGTCGNPYRSLVLFPYIPTSSGDGWTDFLVYSSVFVSSPFSFVFSFNFIIFIHIIHFSLLIVLLFFL